MMKRMKKRALLALVVCLLVLPLLGLAIQVDLGQLAMNLPAACDVFTRNMRPDDPVLTLYGKTSDQVAQELSGEGLLMKAREISGAYTMTLSSRSDGGPDFSSLGDEDLLALAGSYANGAQLDASPILRTRQAAFLLFRGGSRISLVTRVDGSLYRLMLKAEGRLSGSMAEVLNQAARSMDFGRGQ